MANTNTELLMNLIIKNAEECLAILHPQYLDEYHVALGLCMEKMNQMLDVSPMSFLSKIQDTLLIRFFNAFDSKLIEYILDKSVEEFRLNIEHQEKDPEVDTTNVYDKFYEECLSADEKYNTAMEEDNAGRNQPQE